MSSLPDPRGPHAWNTHNPQMLFHDGTIMNTNHHNLSRVSSRSSYTLPSPSNQLFSTMEDINLSTTNHPNSTVKNHRGFILQDFLAKTFSSNVETPTSVNSGLNHVPFDQVLDSVKPSSGLMDHSIGGKRSLSVTDHRTDGDRRHKRMIKNRESAARSRARKQVCNLLTFSFIQVSLSWVEVF